MTRPNSIAKVEMTIRRPIAEVFGAFINPEITSKFWFTSGSSALKEGENLEWSWEMYNLSVPLRVLEIKEIELIRIEWGEGADQSEVKWEFKSITEDITFLTICNYNFKCEGNELIKQVIDSTGGFSLVVAGLKAWLEHGVELNLVGDRVPA